MDNFRRKLWAQERKGKKIHSCADKLCTAVDIFVQESFWLLADEGLAEVDDAAHDNDVREIDLYREFQELAVRTRSCNRCNSNRDALR